MKFIITRTSVWEGCPHPYSIEESVISRTYYRAKTLTEAAYLGLRDLNELKVDETGVYRETLCKVYTIILADIMSFIEENGPCIISNRSEYDFPIIEIYDDWRE